MDILETQLMQRTVNPAIVTAMAPSQKFVTPELGSVSADPMCRGGAVMSVSLKPLACNWEGGVFPATVILLAQSHLTVTKVGSAGASLE